MDWRETHLSKTKMPIPKGQLNQIAFVVRDINTAMKKYGELYMVEQWYRPKTGKGDVMYYRGKRIDPTGMDLIVGYYGNMEIELVRPPCEPSMYSEFLEKYGEGFNHVCIHGRSLAVALKYYETLGFQTVQNGSMCSRFSQTNYAYVARPQDELRLIFELSETIILGKFRVIRGKSAITGGAKLGVVDLIK